MTQAAPTRDAAYLILLAIQTAGAGALIAVAFPFFLQIVSQAGQPLTLETPTALAALGTALVMQACYWLRYRLMPVQAPLRSALIGHFVMFAGRVSFFFGSALFSAIFFRHVPLLASLPPAGHSAAKALGVLALLFALFCYALELERLGRAIE